MNDGISTNGYLTLHSMLDRITILIFLFQFTNCLSQEVKNIELLDQWFEDSLITSSTKVRYSGCWGFTYQHNEYAVIGSTEGYHFFQLTDENTLKPCGFIEGRFNSPQVIHREIKTFANYAYLVCDEGNSSLQIADLTFLPDSVVKVADIQDERFGKIHNIFIDSASALLYACLVTPIPNGNMLNKIPLRVFSLSDPLNPILLWEGPNDIPEVHDCYVRQNIAILHCGMDGIRIYDFTNPLNPHFKNDLTFYQDQGYNHQGWLSPDGKTYVFADETSGKRVKKCRFESNLSLHIENYFGTNFLQNSVPHNIMIDNNFAYIAYYNEGLRIFDIRKTPVEIAAYDTYPQDSYFNMNGAWGVYANFPSGRIVISDRQFGLFLFDWERPVFLNPAQDEFNLYPNPIESQGISIIRTPSDEIDSFSVRIYDATGKALDDQTIENASFAYLIAPERSGVYFLEITYTNYIGERCKLLKKWVVI
jgi:choice-of-anchor B domain-containing protein